MSSILLSLLPALASLVLIAAGVVALRSSATTALALSRAAGLVSLACALGAAVTLATVGSLTSPTLGIAGLGLASRIDPLSLVLFGVIAFVGQVVLEYSRNYLAGNPRHAEFMGKLCLTLAVAMALATAGNVAQLLLAWVATSLTLHKLLLFFADRARAQAAARKKFVTARLGDACLAVAVCLMFQHYGTGDIGQILAAARMDALPAQGALQLATVLLALAALLKCAQFPTHGWLTEVMEAPTPVSALLHAGIINAGGFLVFRFADVMVSSAMSMDLLLVVGGFTALFGSLVMITQTSVKVTLGFSTVAQMGFMLLQCGLGAFSSAGLHLVAHSLYKAHGFLASGDAVDNVRIARADSRGATTSLPMLIASLFGALLIYVLVGAVFDHGVTRSPAVLTLGALFIMGLFVFLARGTGSHSVLLRVLPMAGVAAALYFTLQIAAASFFAPLLPAVPPLGGVGTALVGLVLVSFAALSLFQVMPPAIERRWYRAAYVHLSNGLYANAVFNKLTGALRRDTSLRT